MLEPLNIFEDINDLLIIISLLLLAIALLPHTGFRSAVTYSFESKINAVSSSSSSSSSFWPSSPLPLLSV
jgi:hypothetical protein